LPGLSALLSSEAHAPRSLLSGGGRARRSDAPGSLVVSSFRWSGLDRWTQLWWPQGIAIGQHDGRPIAIVSWFSRVRRGRNRGAKITVVDLTTLRYHHVGLVEGEESAPVAVHAGGILWSGDRLLVAATHGGLREFHLSEIQLRKRRWVLPQFAHLQPVQKFRYSFLAEGTDGVVAGEYAKTDGGRLAHLTVVHGGAVSDGSAASVGSVSATDIHSPGIPQMQGALTVDGRWVVSSSRGDRRNGDLWVGKQGALVKHEGALPPGPEDLAWDRANSLLWGVTEHPGQRWVYSLELPR
jgi:hypothetical protein